MVVTRQSKKHLNVALVSDYFYPSAGGVETHIMMLGSELIRLGHRVIVITHKNGQYSGKMEFRGMTVYYLDLPVVAGNTTFPTLFCSYIIYKSIFVENSIDIAHGHQSMSTLAMEAIYHAQHMNIKSVLTEHSVFEFSKLERILCNSLSRFICRSIDQVISVSKTAGLNTEKRLEVSPKRITIIPNGVDTARFYPKRMSRKRKVRLLFCARFVFRKGINLLVGALPLIGRNKEIEIIIAGDGPMRSCIERAIDEYDLHEQVRLVGLCDFVKMPDLLRSCDIFLSTSLTETFCMAILEAVACGLLAVSTNVGGVHEIFEPGVVYFCRPEPSDIAAQVFRAVKDLSTHDPMRNYERLIKKYDWSIIAKKTESVYLRIMDESNTCLKQEKDKTAFVFRVIEWFNDFQKRMIG